MASRAQFQNFKAFDINADLLIGGLLYTYDPGTTNLKTTYSDSAETAAHTNPIVLDSLGESEIFISGLTKFVLHDATDSPIDTWDNVEALSTSSDTLITDLAANTGASLIGWIRAATGAVAHTVLEWINWKPATAFDFMTAAEIADVQAGTALVDITTALQAAITASMRLELPNGTYGISTTLTKDATGFKLFGESEGGVNIIPLVGFSGETDSDGNHVLIRCGNGVTSRYFNHIKHITFQDPKLIGNVCAIVYDKVNNQSRISECAFLTTMEKGFEFKNQSLANVVYRNKFAGTNVSGKLIEDAGNSTCIVQNYMSNAGKFWMSGAMTDVKIIDNVWDGTAYIVGDIGGGASGQRGCTISRNRFEHSSASIPIIQVGLTRGLRIMDNFFQGKGLVTTAIHLTNTSSIQSAVIANNYHENIITTFVKSSLPDGLISVYNNRHDPSSSSPTLEYDMNESSTSFEGAVIAGRFSTAGSDPRVRELAVAKSGIANGVATDVFTITTDGTRGSYVVEVSQNLSFSPNSTAEAAGHSKYSWAHSTDNTFASVDSAVTVDSVLKVAARLPGSRTITSVVATATTTSATVTTFALNPVLVGSGSPEAIVQIRVIYDQYSAAPVIAVA